MDKKKVKMPGMTRSYSLLPETINEEERTIELVWTTGARAQQYNSMFGGWYTEELLVTHEAVNMERFQSGAMPYLNMHEAWSLASILGVVEEAWIDEEKKEGRARVRFAKGDPDIDRIWNLITQRIVCNTSVGYTVEEYEIYEENGKKIYRAIKWTPVELSAVTVPADPQATTRAKQVNLGDCFVAYRAKREKDMAKNKRLEDEEIEKLEEEMDPADQIRQENPENNEELEEKKQKEDEPVPISEEEEPVSQRKQQVLTTRRDYIYNLCEAAGLSIAQARQFNQSDLSVKEIRTKILEKRSEAFQPISNMRNVNVDKSGSLSERAAKVYLKKGE